MSLVELQGTAATQLRLTLPAWGTWWADVSTVDPVDVAAGAQVTLTVAAVECSCAVVAAGSVEGRGGYRLVGGAGGWGHDVERRGYRDDIGVRASSVVGDAASAVGETIGTTLSTRLGPRYARSAGPASRVLESIVPRSWYVGLDGVTYLVPRSSSAYTGDAPQTRVDPANAVLELATESIAGLVPGVVVDGGEPATDVEYTLAGDRLTVRLYRGTSTSRRADAWRRILDSLDPHRRYRAGYEYRVVRQVSERLDLQPVRTASGMPDLAGVPVRFASGVRASHTLGSTVMVSFADGDPGRPYVSSGEEAGAPGWMPLECRLGDDPILGVARQTDSVIAGGFAGTITTASLRVKAGL